MTMRIPVESAVLTGSLHLSASSQGLIVLAHAGVNDSYATHPAEMRAALHRRGLGTLSVNLLAPTEEDQDRASGRHHLDVPFLAARICQVLGVIRCHPECRRYPLGLFVEGMAAAAAVSSASHHQEVRAIVSWNGRADLAGDALGNLDAPTLLLTTADQPHVVDLNRKAAAMLRAINTIEEVDLRGHDAHPDRAIAERAADWFIAFVVNDDTGPAARSIERYRATSPEDFGGSDDLAQQHSGSH